ncbi:MAG: S41 family peptidase [Bacteroidales bacterium]
MSAKTILITLITLFINNLSFSQTNDCLKDFDFLVKKIQADYPGYNDKVNDANRSHLLLLEKEIRQKITTHPDSCEYYFNDYTDFFKDQHLRVSRIWKEGNQQSEVMHISTYGKILNFNVDSLAEETKNAIGIEGVWEGFRERFFIARDGKKYVGVVLNKQGWKRGQIIYEFEPFKDTLFNVTNYSLIEEKKTYKTKASLHLSGKILEFHNVTRFVRKSDSDILDKSVLYSYVPEFPNGINTFPLAMYLGDSTYYIRIPSFYNNTGNKLLRQHWNEITARPNLIVDIRNNGGGQDQYYQELNKLIYSKPYESKGVEWYASRGNIKSFEDAMEKGEIRNGEEGMKWTQALVEAMKKNIGGFVTHPFDADESETVKMDTVYSMPRNIGIIINELNASAAEQFLLAARQSDKVILFGNNSTAGVLDYSNITPNNLPSGNYQLWCPMTRSKRLPENPVDNIGIAPDVIIPFPATEQLYDRLDTWVYFVKNYLELLNEENK